MGRPPRDTVFDLHSKPSKDDLPWTGRRLRSAVSARHLRTTDTVQPPEPSSVVLEGFGTESVPVPPPRPTSNAGGVGTPGRVPKRCFRHYVSKSAGGIPGLLGGSGGCTAIARNLCL